MRRGKLTAEAVPSDVRIATLLKQMQTSNVPLQRPFASAASLAITSSLLIFKS